MNSDMDFWILVIGAVIAVMKALELYMVQLKK